jgi:hypothetical protein
MDAYWAKDIQELFRLGRRDSFQRFTEMVMAQSGGLFDATRFAFGTRINAGDSFDITRHLVFPQ